MITCTFENGDQGSLRHVTVNAIVIRDGKVLMGRRSAVPGRVILEVGKLALLGGYFDRDETLEQAVKREVLEESGWEIDNLRLFRIVDKPNRPNEDRQNVDIVFLCDAVQDTGKTDREMSELIWVNVDGITDAGAFAFDHGDDIMLFKKYLRKPFPLPVLG